MPFRSASDIVASNPAEPKMNSGEDIARSGGTGVLQGLAGTFGAGGDLLALAKTLPEKGAQALEDRKVLPKGSAALLAQAMEKNPVAQGAQGKAVDAGRAAIIAALKGTGAGGDKAVAAANLVPSPTRFPSTKDIETVLGAEKVYHKPQTKGGEYARTLGQFAPAAIMPGGALARTANVVVPAVASEAAGQATKDTQLEPYARLAGALAGGGVSALALRPPPAPRMLANATRNITDQHIAAAQALREDALRRGVTLTQAEAIQQVTDGATGLGRLQRVLEGTPVGGERLGPMMAQRPGQVRQAVANYADTVVPATDAPSMLGAQAQDAAGGAINQVRQDINATAKPFYDRLPGQSLPDEAFQQLSANPSYAKALEQLRHDPELSPLLQAELPMDQGARMTRAQQQGFNPETPYYHGTGGDFTGELQASADGALGPGVYVTKSPLQAGNYSTMGGMQGGSPNIRPVLLRDGSIADQAGAAAVVRDPTDVRSTFDQFAPPHPDNDLNVINRVVQQLDQLKESATPSAVNPQGNFTLAAERGKARTMADQLASDASPDWRQARDAVAQGRAERLDPLQRGPLGAVSSSPDVKAQTSALFPSQPLEGAPAETAQAMQLLGGREGSVAPGLARQHLMNSANEAMQNLQPGANQWGGAKFAATIAGNPEQRATLMAGVGGAGGDVDNLAALLEVLGATGKRQAAGSQTAYNIEDLKALGDSGAVGEVLKTGLNPPGVFRRLGDAFQGHQVNRNASALADALLADPAKAAQILTEARRTVPPGAALEQIERLALTTALAREQPGQMQSAP